MAVVRLKIIYCLIYYSLFVGVLCLSLFCYALLCVHSSFAIILKRKRKLVALLLLSYRCIVAINVLWVFLTILLLVCSVWSCYFLIILTYFFRPIFRKVKILHKKCIYNAAFYIPNLRGRQNMTYHISSLGIRYVLLAFKYKQKQKQQKEPYSLFLN